MKARDEDVRRHLMKCELQFRVESLDDEEWDEVEWLAPFCGSTDKLRIFLQLIGFQIKEVVDEEEMKWAETTSGVLVYVGGNGMFTKSARRREREKAAGMRKKISKERE